jgi:O-antigen ligase
MKQNDNSRHLIRWLVLIVLFVTPFVIAPFGLYHDYFYAPKVYFYTIIVVVFLILLLLNRQYLLTIIHPDSINALILVYALLLVVSSVFALDPFRALLGTYGRVEGLSTMFVYFMLFLMARASAPLKDKHWDILLVVVSIVAIYGILQTFNIDPIPRDYIREGWIRAFSTIGNPNFLGSYLVLAIPLAMHRYLHQHKSYALVMYTIMLYALLATMTRGAWIGFFGAMIVYFGLAWFHRSSLSITKQRIMALTLVSVVTVILYNGLSDGGFLARLITIGTDVTTIIEGGEVIDRVGSSRMYIWLKTIDLIQMRPFLGFGLENLGLAFHEYFSADLINHWGDLVILDKAHNEYLNIAVTSGIPSLLVYVSLIALIIKKGWAKLVSTSIGLGLLTAITGYAFQAFFNISVVSVAYVFWIFLGLWCQQDQTK